MDENKLEEELLRSFSRIFLKIGQYNKSKDSKDLKRIQREISIYNKFKETYKKPTQRYDNIIGFTLNELN